MSKSNRRQNTTHPVKVFFLGVLFVLLSTVAVFFYSATEESERARQLHLQGYGRTPRAPVAVSDGEKTEAPDVEVAVTLYGQSAADPSKLVPLRVKLRKANDLRATVRSVVAALQAPLPDERVLAPLPKGTSVLSVFQDRGDLYVDLSREFVQHHPGGTLESLVTLYALVNTLTRIGSVTRVKILVGGQEAIDYKEHLDLRPFYAYNASLVVGEDPVHGQPATPATSQPGR